jgi:hypothetical protein
MMACYPECDKALEVREESQAIGNFLAWLDENHFTICERNTGGWTGHYMPTRKSIETLLAKYFWIDLTISRVPSSRLLPAGS